MVDVRVEVGDLPVGRSRMVEQGGRKFLVCRSTKDVHATAGMCPHQVKSLDGARVRGETLMCLHHGASFRLDTGASLSFALTARPLAIYPSRLEGEVLHVSLPD